ncbi:MAG: LptF/LptG family permease [Bacteriovorax sp.]|nr:LptF/LptG family permease [Bacteriovorax sp.]
MFKVTTRYLAATFIPPFVVGFIFFVAFLNTFYMFRIIDLIVTKGVEISIVLGMVLNLSVTFFSLAAPLAAFFATLYTLNKLSDDSEIIAMRSFGITKFKIYFPFLLVSLTIALMIVSLDSNYIPKANSNFKNTVMKLTSKGMLTRIQSGHFFTDIPNATLFAEGVSTEGDNFTNIFIHVKEKSSGEERIIFANHGSLIKLYADGWHAPSLRMHLTEGNIAKLSISGEQIEKILFHEYDFPIFSADFASEMLDKDSMKTNRELKNAIEKRQKDYVFLERTPPANPEEVNSRKNARHLITKSRIEYFARFITFPQIVLFVLLGFSLGIKNVRGGGGNNTIRAIIILLGYYGLYFLCLSFAQKELISATVASFAPSVILTCVAVYYFKKLDWVG